MWYGVLDTKTANHMVVYTSAHAHVVLSISYEFML